MSGLSPETRHLLELSRLGEEAPPIREQRVRHALVSQLGMTALASAAAASVVGTAGVTSAASASALTGSASTTALGSAATGVSSVSATTATIVKTVAGLTLVASLGAGSLPFGLGGTVELARDEAAPTSSVARPSASPPLVVDSPSKQDEEPSPASAAPSSAVLAIDESVDHDPSRHEQLISIARRPGRPIAIESELVLVERAERAIAAKHYQLAQRYLSAHASKYAGGALRENREALRVLIDCALGAADRARAGAARFAEVFADSDQLPRVRACTKKL